MAWYYSEVLNQITEIIKIVVAHGNKKRVLKKLHFFFKLGTVITVIDRFSGYFQL